MERLDPIPRPNDIQDPEHTAVDGEARAAPEMDEKLTLFQWIERLSYRFLGHAITSFVIRRRFVLTRVFLVFMYWLVGVQYYSSKEGWTEYDAAYYITVTTTTVGYGDYHPSTDETRLFTVFYAIFGIAFVLTAVTDIINYVIVRKLQPRVLSWLNVTKMETKAWFKIIFSGMCILTMIAVGTAFFQTNEGWSTTMAFYWTMITMLTIGYGDTPNGVPINDSSRKFSIWFIWTCVVIYIMALSNIYDTFEELKNEALRKEILRAHRVDIVEQLEKDRKGRDTSASNTPRGILSFTRASLASIYPESDEIRYENSPIDSNRQGDIELAVGSTKPTISPLMNNDSLKALIKSESTTTEVLAESKSITHTSSVSSPTVFFGSRGSIEPTRNSSVSDSRSSSLYQGAQRRGSMFDDLDVLQSKTNAFVLDMLIKMKKVDKEKDIDPLVKHFEKIGVMREENKDVSKEMVARMFVETLDTGKSTLSSFAATLVGNKKIVVQKRASEIDKTIKRRESSDPRSDQAKQSTNKKPFGLGGNGNQSTASKLFPSMDGDQGGGGDVPHPPSRKQSSLGSVSEAIQEGDDEED